VESRMLPYSMNTLGTVERFSWPRSPRGMMPFVIAGPCPLGYARTPSTRIAGFGHAGTGVDELSDFGRMRFVATVMASVDSDDFSGKRKLSDSCCGGG